jgi:CRISPR-associated Cas5-like protein
MDALHVRLAGYTASFRHPLILSGTQAILPVPAISSLMGMISACTGRWVSPAETRLAFEYSFCGQGADLQTTHRWELKGGRLKPNHKGLRGIARRQFQIEPVLDLYVSNTELRPFFENPVAIPRFGRSEDLAWLTFVRPVTLEPRARGHIGATLLRADHGVHGLPLTLVEWFHAPRMGCLRQAGAMGRFVALPPSGNTRFEVETASLYHPSDADNDQAVVYLHEWSAMPGEAR